MPKRFEKNPKSIAESRALPQLQLGHCYHCDAPPPDNILCEVWNIWTCKQCRRTHHFVHHDSCSIDTKLPDPNKKNKYQRTNRNFSIMLTRYNGHQFLMTCQLGQKLDMEEHWLGTYIFLPGSMIMVQEKLKTINDRILESLQSSGNNRK